MLSTNPSSLRSTYTQTTTERDADSFGPVAEVAPELGSIAIKIYRGTAKENTVYFSTDRDDPVCSFDELAVKKKSTTEAVGLATVPTPAVQARVRAFDYLDPPGEPPFQIFTFIYRSRAVLLARGIIKGERDQSRRSCDAFADRLLTTLCTCGHGRLFSSVIHRAISSSSRHVFLRTARCGRDHRLV